MFRLDRPRFAINQVIDKTVLALFFSIACLSNSVFMILPSNNTSMRDNLSTSTILPVVQGYSLNYNKEIVLNSDCLVISMKIITDKTIYKPRELVAITVKNDGNYTLTFPDSALGLKIRNLETGEVYKLIAAQVLTELSPDESKVIIWSQEDNEGNQVSNGNYRADITSGSLTANAIFRVEGFPE
jgi:hypothetical protein